MALGAAISVLAVTTRMIYLLPVMGFMYILSTISVILQVGSFKLRHKRVFRMAPLHHHFELKGMHETRIVVMSLCMDAGLYHFGHRLAGQPVGKGSIKKGKRTMKEMKDKQVLIVEHGQKWRGSGPHAQPALGAKLTLTDTRNSEQMASAIEQLRDIDANWQLGVGPGWR